MLTAAMGADASFCVVHASCACLTSTDCSWCRGGVWSCVTAAAAAAAAHTSSVRIAKPNHLTRFCTAGFPLFGKYTCRAEVVLDICLRVQQLAAPIDKRNYAEAGPARRAYIQKASDVESCIL